MWWNVMECNVYLHFSLWNVPLREHTHTHTPKAWTLLPQFMASCLFSAPLPRHRRKWKTETSHKARDGSGNETCHPLFPLSQIAAFLPPESEEFGPPPPCDWRRLFGQGGTEWFSEGPNMNCLKAPGIQVYIYIYTHVVLIRKCIYICILCMHTHSGIIYIYIHSQVKLWYRVEDLQKLWTPCVTFREARSKEVGQRRWVPWSLPENRQETLVSCRSE